MARIPIGNKGLWAAGLLLVLGTGVAASGLSQSGSRADCPGRVVCKDQCPLAKAERSDCPGQIECPLTGEPVCRDQCPLAANDEAASAGDGLPPCCRRDK